MEAVDRQDSLPMSQRAGAVGLVRAELRRWWREHRCIIGVIAGYCAATVAVLQWRGLPHLSAVPAVNGVLLAMTLAWGVARAIVEFGDRRFSIRHWLAALPGAVTVALVTPVFLVAFSSWKQGLVRLVPFDWDPSLHVWSVALHGRPEWQWFWWVYDNPAVLRAVDFLYGPGWAFGLLATLLGVAWSDRREFRSRFLLVMVLIWIVLGSGMAAMAGSGGPVFYHLFVSGISPYQDLVSELSRHDGLINPRLAEELESSFRSQEWRLFSGISAMPSLHVAQAMLTGLLCHTFRVTWLRVTGWAYVGVILVGSVVLGWHYALDGYVSMALTLVIWRASGLSSLARQGRV